MLFFFASGYLLLDYGLVTANAEITHWMLKQKEIAAFKAKKDALKDVSVIRSKVGAYKSKDFYVSNLFYRHWLCVLLRKGQ